MSPRRPEASLDAASRRGAAFGADRPGCDREEESMWSGSRIAAHLQVFNRMGLSEVPFPPLRSVPGVATLHSIPKGDGQRMPRKIYATAEHVQECPIFKAGDKMAVAL